MKTKTITGCLLAVCLLMLLPAVSAVEYKTYVDSNRTQLIETLKKLAPPDPTKNPIWFLITWIAWFAIDVVEIGLVIKFLTHTDFKASAFIAILLLLLGMSHCAIKVLRAYNQLDTQP